MVKKVFWSNEETNDEVISSTVKDLVKVAMGMGQRGEYFGKS